ncbi:MAG: xanthine dehydrogenase family protein molybdopterin-binding subunit [Candidatus Hydrogenedentes bacterium]|nr:xanthine dehydrogenase family protein molybdopterin-binding subunit [Candidatus Hydrogenedentota bacterium]
MSAERNPIELERYELEEKPRYRFSLSRRAFVQTVGAGLLITSFGKFGRAQERAGKGRAVAGRFLFDKDGIVMALTGKVELGQGARTQLSQAVAEELRVPLSQVRLIMGDTDSVPNDGGTYGSQTTPRTVPTVRQAAASARELVVELACEQWGVKPDSTAMRDGVIEHSDGRKMTLAELVAKVGDVGAALAGKTSERIELTPADAWRVLGKLEGKVAAIELVTGKHRFPSDIKRPDMLYGKVLRPPSFDAELVDLDSKAAESLEGVTVVRDGSFVGCTAPTTFQARKALEALVATARWNTKPHPSSSELFRVLKETANSGSGRDRPRGSEQGDVGAAMAAADKVVLASYEVPYIQHAPMEPRAAVAEWVDGKLTVWTGTQTPFNVRGELAEAFSISEENVRVIMPDAGGGFGGKHRGDAAVEAARLAKAVKRPVAVHWTREEEFTWAYFRPAGLLEVAAAIDNAGKVTAWDFTNYNSGGSALDCPYTFPNKRVKSQPCDSPLRQGSYRALAATANNFAREAFIDRLAAETSADPLAFRLAYLEDGQLKEVLNAVAKQFKWTERRQDKATDTGYGIACGTEKGSFIATCVEIHVNAPTKEIQVRRVCAAFECGAVQNPANLKSQIEGCLIMGLGAALFETIQFQDGRITTNNFKQYRVPRFKDVPEIDVVILNRPDLPSAGAGETPIIAIAPAIANALHHATGTPLQALPLTVS